MKVIYFAFLAIVLASTTFIPGNSQAGGCISSKSFTQSSCPTGQVHGYSYSCSNGVNGASQGGSSSDGQIQCFSIRSVFREIRKACECERPRRDRRNR